MLFHLAHNNQTSIGLIVDWHVSCLLTLQYVENVLVQSISTCSQDLDIWELGSGGSAWRFVWVYMGMGYKRLDVGDLVVRFGNKLFEFIEFELNLERMSLSDCRTGCKPDE